MPKIPESAKSKGSSFLKPTSFDPPLNYGDRAEFTITSPHVETKQKSGDPSFSISVETNKTPSKGSFSLNKTNMKILSDVLGDDSDVWVSAKFSALVTTKRNPQTGVQVPGWDILQNTIQKSTKKAGAK